MTSNSSTASNLAGQTVAIFGGSSGIGLAAAKLARQSGANVILIARNADRLRQAAAEIGSATVVSADITAPDSIDALAQAVSRIDHLVITAGTAALRPLQDQSADYLTRLAAERLIGPLLAIRALRAKLNPQGSITLTSAQLAARPIAVGSAIAGLVAATETIARALALELSPLRVNAFAPGMVDTPLLDSLLGDNKTQVLAATAASTPAKRNGRPEDVAQAILFLITNPYMSGEVLHIDGGGRWV